MGLFVLPRSLVLAIALFILTYILIHVYGNEIKREKSVQRWKQFYC